MKKKISLLLMLVTMLGFSIQSYAANEKIYYWDKYSYEANHKITRKEWTSKVIGGTWYNARTLWDISIDSNEDIILTKTSISSKTSELTNYGYKVGDFIGLYLLHNEEDLGSFLIGHKFNYSQALRDKKTVNLNYYKTLMEYENVDMDVNYIRSNPYGNYLRKELALDKNYILQSQLGQVSSTNSNSYPNDGVLNGYYYKFSHSEDMNKNPELTIIEPLKNQRIGNQDAVIVSGKVKDVDIGNVLDVKYNLETIKNQDITLTQPTNIVSSGQWQTFQGYIQLQGLKTGTNLLELWTEDNQGGKSKTVEMPIVIFSTLENILDALKKYTVKAGNPQFMIINSDSRIVQNIENDRLIEQIKKELHSKNIKLFFSGRNGETEAYINSKLLN
ncbi:hypothetical protein [Proteiniborus sp. MB09-C3]|uniref:hypothetical protein n=1 Tax=Proteiniborus sp. MB09-C3 TaxID=3050072 RepID=UPI0025525E18|nr:hypothetical protein [Proteiniborus sp. MB09-C3]WIV11126.1 hypothetical protein QO263_13335 [Proteiniborus sp. MB09-C3]